ncbi:hypothetical protein BGW38_003394, partial [Lunasporangiospora selenospora]
MNVNAASFIPQGNSGSDNSSNKSSSNNNSGSSNHFRSTGLTVNESKKSNRSGGGGGGSGSGATVSTKNSFPAEQAQRSLPGRGKNQRQSNSKRSGHERESSSQHNRNSGSGRQQQLSSTTSSDSLVSSMSQVSLRGNGGGGNAAAAKKNQVSLNHLLNFSFPAREEPQNTGPVRRRRNVNYEPFNKEKFINANFRFLMNPRSDYTVFTMDADVRVQWEDIEQVLMAVPQSCPICLQPPVAARITKCGHVYCYPCVLHYLALGESSKAWRKCPICWDSIYEKDLKSVQSLHRDEHEHLAYDQGEKEIAKQIAAKQEVRIDMRLIQRALNTTIALPRSATFPLTAKVLPDELKGNLPLEFYPDAMAFSRLMVTTLDRILSELDFDIHAIEVSIEEAKTYASDNYAEETVFFEMALDKIQERKDKIKEDAKFFPKAALDRERILREYCGRVAQEPIDSESAKDETVEEPNRPSIVYDQLGPEAYQMNDKSPKEASEPELMLTGAGDTNPAGPETPSEAEPSSNSKQVTSRRSTGNKSANPTTAVYYFYQAANGHHLYLQPLDIRILKQHFDAYDRFPDAIKVQVLGIEETSLTEEVRKKCKYLSHLPLGCEVSFLDVALEDIVSNESLKPFEAELRLRRAKRREKEAREERERIERERRMNPGRPARDEQMFANDPFFHVPEAAGARTGSGADTLRRQSRESDLDLQEALRLSQAAYEE